MNALGFIEVPFLSVAAVVADAAAKAARVSMLGFEATGNENILIRLGGGGVSDVEAALAAADESATRLGASAIVQAIARPEEAMIAMIHFPNANNLSGPSPAPVPRCSSSGVFTRIGLNVAAWSPIYRPDSKRTRKSQPKRTPLSVEMKHDPVSPGRLADARLPRPSAACHRQPGPAQAITSAFSEGGAVPAPLPGRSCPAPYPSSDCRRGSVHEGGLILNYHE
jgi:hypothetical protein